MTNETLLNYGLPTVGMALAVLGVSWAAFESWLFKRRHPDYEARRQQPPGVSTVDQALKESLELQPGLAKQNEMLLQRIKTLQNSANRRSAVLDGADSAKGRRSNTPFKARKGLRLGRCPKPRQRRAFGIKFVRIGFSRLSLERVQGSALALLTSHVIVFASWYRMETNAAGP